VVSHVTEAAEGIYRLTNGVANFYLIQGAGTLVLGDAGAPKAWRYSPRQPPGGKDLSSAAAARIAVSAPNSRWAPARSPWPIGKGASQQGGQPCEGQACAL
jgi:hypothetical protein